MMKFKWLLPDCDTRFGVRLIKDQEYEIGQIPLHVVQHWVSTGAAEWVKEKKKEKTEIKGGE